MQPRTPGGGGGAGGQGKRFPEGQFDHFYPNEVACWINISPWQLYKQEVYDRKTKEVLETETTWFESQKHYCAFNKGVLDSSGKKMPMDFRCSRGARKECPCWGCVLLDAHYDKVRQIEEKSGVRPQMNAPIGRIPQFAFGITIMENIYSIPMRTGDGKVRKDKKGKTLFRHVPAPFAEADARTSEAMLKNAAITKGHRAHWELGTSELNYLLEQDKVMRRCCGNCASDLVCREMVCPGCETAVTLRSPAMGIDIDTEEKKVRTCDLCGEKGPYVPRYSCDECGDPVEGRLTGFDIRVRRTKTPTGYILEIVGIRLPGVPDSTLEEHENVMRLIQNPLKVDEIYGPTDLPRQAMICASRIGGLKLQEVSENAGSETESYADDSEIDFSKDE